MAPVSHRRFPNEEHLRRSSSPLSAQCVIILYLDRQETRVWLIILGEGWINAQEASRADVRELLATLTVGVTDDSKCRDSVLDIISGRHLCRTTRSASMSAETGRLGCLTELFPRLSMLQLPMLFSRVNGDRDDESSLNVFVDALNKIKDRADSSSFVEKCCQFECDIAGDACRCYQDMFVAFKDILQDETLGLLTRFRDVCLESNPNLHFNLTIFDTDSCRLEKIKKEQDFECRP